MSRIPQTFIDDLLSRVDIVDVIDRRVKLKRAGKNYSACCPFHDEKTPSFTVSPDKQFYYCFGCGATGSALGFIIEYERQGFIDAVESLAKTAGVEVPREQTPGSQEKDFRRKKLYQSLENSSAFFQNQLRQHPQKHQAVNYLKGRGLTGHIAKDFGIGYAPPGYSNLLSALGRNEEAIELLIDAGLVISKPEENKKYDRFRHRITFPIRDERGRVIGFGGRVLGDDKPKYLNSPETDVFQKGRELYGLYEAKQAQRKLEGLIVVEGYMDVIALAQYGIRNAVATLGTACGEDHLRLAFRFVSEVVFCFDGDAAGRNAAKRALTNCLSSMEDGRQIKFLFLAEGQDPDSLVRQIGAERFQAEIKNAIPLEEYLFDVAAEGVDLGNLDGRARFSKIAAPLVGQLPQGVFRALMLDNLAKRTGLSPEVLRELQHEAIALPEEAIQPKQTHHETPPQVTDEAEVIPPNDTAPPAADIDYEYFEPDTQGYEDYPAAPDQPVEKPRRQSSLNLSPAKTATILLLEDPKLLETIDDVPEFEDDESGDLTRLNEIIAYLRKRPNSNFNNILGFWGGAKGVEQQQALAKLVANQLLSSAKTVNTYDPASELQGAIQRLTKDRDRKAKLDELNTLKAMGLNKLNAEQKLRFVELTKLTH